MSLLNVELSHLFSNVVKKYNKLFSEHRPRMHLTLAVADKRVCPLLSTFNRHPPSQRSIFLNAFSQSAWDCLSSRRKGQNTLQQCLTCHTYHLSLTLSFPDKKEKLLLQHEAPVIAFNKQDSSSASNLGKKALKELNIICENQFKKSAQTFIAETPLSKLTVKPSSADRQSEKRKIVREAKKVIQQSMDDSSTSTVMMNRMSWRKFDMIRKTQTLDNNSTLSQPPSRKWKHLQSDENFPPSKRKHGSLTLLPKATQEVILAEA